MPEEITLAIIMVNYRTPLLAIDAIASLIPEITSLNAKMFIVDNCSGDDSTSVIGEWIARHDYARQVRLLKSLGNFGFSGGNNYAINAVKAEFYLLINSDTVVGEGAVGTLIRTAETYQKAGLFSPRLEWANGDPQESCFNFHRPLSEMIRSAGTGVVTHLLRKYIVAHAVCNDVTKPEWTSFACVLIRRKVFDDIGLMSDDFFMYYEDVEFCMRARKAGWHIVNNPEARVIHLRGGSSIVKGNTMLRKRLPRYYYESRTKYFYKCFGQRGLLLANIYWTLGRSISLFRELIGNKRVHACEREWLDIWTNFLSPKRPSVMYKDIQ